MENGSLRTVLLALAANAGITVLALSEALVRADIVPVGQ